MDEALGWILATVLGVALFFIVFMVAFYVALFLIFITVLFVGGVAAFLLGIMELVGLDTGKKEAE